MVTPDVQVSTFWKDLGHPTLEDDSSPENDATRSATAKVDIGHFVKFLHCAPLEPDNIILCICEGYGVILYVLKQNGGSELSLTYYLPLLSDESQFD